MSLSTTTRALGRAQIARTRSLANALRAPTRSALAARSNTAIVSSRPYSSGSGSGSSSGSSSSKAPLWGLGAFNLGLGGYWLANSDGTATVNSEPVYGTPEDFVRAVADLRAKLGEAKVSTDADDLLGHGFSAIDHHPSTLSLSHTGPSSPTHPLPQRCSIPLSSTPSPRKRSRRWSKSQTNIACLSFPTLEGRAWKVNSAG